MVAGTRSRIRASTNVEAVQLWWNVAFNREFAAGVLLLCRRPITAQKPGRLLLFHTRLPLMQDILRGYGG